MSQHVRSRIVHELREIEAIADKTQRLATRSALSWLALALLALPVAHWLDGWPEALTVAAVLGCVVMAVSLAGAGLLCLYNRYNARRMLRQMGEGL